jgi:hypothetical protein
MFIGFHRIGPLCSSSKGVEIQEEKMLLTDISMLLNTIAASRSKNKKFVRTIMGLTILYSIIRIITLVRDSRE